MNLFFLKKLFSDGEFGLQITDSFIVALQLNGSGNDPHVKSMGRIELPAGTVVKGEIINSKLVAEKIKTLLANTKPLQIKGINCHLSIPEAQCYENVFYIDAGIKRDAFQSQLQKMIADKIPVPFDEIKYDYAVRVINKVSMVYMVAARKEVIARYHEVTRLLNNLNPITLEPESLSLLRNINLFGAEDKVIILIDLRKEDVAWFALWEEEIFDSNFVKMEALPADLKKSIDIFTAKTGRKIDRILIAGKQKNSSTLANDLNKNTGLPVSFVDKYRAVLKLSKSDDPMDFKTVAGLALKGIGVDTKIKINLFKKY